jgi:pyridoxine 5-phosphate synthase
MSKQQPILLGVNIDHVATIRQARGTRYPEPVHAALIAEQHGADAITLHLREDRRHIQERDVLMLKDMLTTRMNLEMAVTDEMLAFAEKIKPDDCCLVPERREELTTEGGLDVYSQPDRIKMACNRLADASVRVSLFIDADEKQIDAAKACGAPVIEIHTGHYADTLSASARQREFEKISHAIEYGTRIGLHVNAGHGLDYHNVSDVAALADVRELNIGHSIVSRAIFTGMAEAVAEMKRIMQTARSRN